MKIRILTVILLLSSVSLFSQKNKYLSVNLSGLLATRSSLNLGAGFEYEEQLVKHHGYQFGLNYRSKTSDNYFIINNNYVNVNVRQNYLNLPISYKFYSNIVNFTTGISFDCFLGGDYLTEIPNVQFGKYDLNPKFYVGWNFKLGKAFNLSDKFVLEPELQYNPIFNYGYSFYGAILKLKYRL